MTYDEAITRLETAGLIEEAFTFIELERPPAGAYVFAGVEIADPDPRHVGGDGSGGAYVRLASSAHVLIDSEGEAGIVGSDLRHMLALAIGVVGLMNALKFVGIADVEDARVRYRDWRAQWRIPQSADNDPAAQEILAALDLSVPTDPFGALHRIVRSTPAGLVRGAEGPWPLFGTQFPAP